MNVWEVIAVAEEIREVVLVRGRDNFKFQPVRVRVDLDDAEALTQHLITIARREDDRDEGTAWVMDYTLEIRNPGQPWLADFTHQPSPPR